MAHRITKLLVSIIFLAVLVGGAWYLLRQPDTTQAPTYSQTQVRRDNISAVVSSTGTLNPEPYQHSAGG